MAHKVLSPVEHDGTRYEEGAMISLPEDAAAALLVAGVLEMVETVASDAKKSRGGDG